MLESRETKLQLPVGDVAFSERLLELANYRIPFGDGVRPGRLWLGQVLGRRGARRSQQSEDTSDRQRAAQHMSQPLAPDTILQTHSLTVFSPPGDFAHTQL
jgi:hypothetical protein